MKTLILTAMLAVTVVSGVVATSYPANASPRPCGAPCGYRPGGN